VALRRPVFPGVGEGDVQPASIAPSMAAAITSVLIRIIDSLSARVSNSTTGYTRQDSRSPPAAQEARAAGQAQSRPDS
jgi:hypothetical protein